MILGALVIGNSSMSTLSYFTNLANVGTNGGLFAVGSKAYSVVVTGL